MRFSENPSFSFSGFIWHSSTLQDQSIITHHKPSFNTEKLLFHLLKTGDVFFKPNLCHLCLTHMLMIRCLEEDDNTGLVNLSVITDEGFIGIAFIIPCWLKQQVFLCFPTQRFPHFQMIHSIVHCYLKWRSKHTDTQHLICADEPWEWE